jgi:type VI protein secretion system component VasA
MATPAALREQSRLYMEAARKELAPHLKRLLESHAFALAQLAEKIEREQAEESKV